MYDIKWIRENPAEFDKAMDRRKMEVRSSEILELDKSVRSIQTNLQDMQQRRNEASKQISVVKKEGGDADAIIKEVSDIKQNMVTVEEDVKTQSSQLTDLLSSLPNRPADDVPDGVDEDDNVEVRRVGKPKAFNFKPLDHDVIGEKLGLMDFAAAAKLSGSRFVVLKGALARLERAIAQFMLDLQTGEEHGYTEVNPPVLVKDHVLYGTGQLPKFADDLFKTEGDHWLIPTAEVPLTNLVANEILDEKDLPKRYTAFTLCFRSEAGAAGKDTRGMIRQHQFEKVELVSIVKPEESFNELERKTNCAEEVLKQLGLPYRVITLCMGDMGFSASKTYDIEVWLPGQDRYREISSCSNCLDFQARRMNARFRRNGEKGTEFVHTLNGSGLAVGRTMIAVMENYQQEDGSIVVPEVLLPYMGGLEVIKV
ncbi:MAG: serine--tRNA ligase [Alphaproteobacteria bacterium]|nr:serine--tRNA ligase [Alphaproteobacteria bacterium]